VPSRFRRNYRRRLLGALVSLQNLDDMPCFSKEKRLAAAFMQGGTTAESTLRAEIKLEEEEARAQHRLAFDTMVQQAKDDASAGRSVVCKPDRFVACVQGALPTDICIACTC
jgi:hypothetical protein